MRATMSRTVLLEPTRRPGLRRIPPGMGASRGELAACAAALLVLAVAVFGSHVVHGGFYWDDWQLAARERFPPAASPDYHGTLDLTLVGYRPVLALLLPAIHAVLGFHMWLHLALALLLAVATGLCFFAFLREAGLPAVHAGAIAALSMVFPWSDSMRLWSTAAVNTVGVCLYLLGTVAALRGLRARGRRAAVLAVTGAVLYALSILTYEVAAAAALLSVLLYARIVPWRRALGRWTLDVVAVGAPLAFVALNTPRSKEGPEGLLDHAATIGDQALTLLARAAIPFGSPPRAVGLAAVGAIVAAAALIARRRRWLAIAGAAALGVVAAYVLIVPADAHYQPLAPGVNNRINLLAALPYAALVYAVAMLAGEVVFAAAPRRPAAGTVVAAAAILAVGGGWIARHRADQAHWDRSRDLQDQVLAAIERALPNPPRGATIYTYGGRTYTAPGVPVFSVSWDLTGAVRLAYDRSALRGFALPGNARLRCDDAGVTPVSRAYGPLQRAPYGRAFAVDVRTARATAIAGPAACRAAGRRIAAPAS